MKIKNYILILPHCGKNGGAGIYIQNLVDILKVSVKLKIGGRFGSYYDNDNITSVFSGRFAELSFPVYSGISSIKILYHLAVSFVRIPFLLFLLKVNKLEDIPTAFILTSVTQALLVKIIKLFYPSSKIIIAVQEHVDLSTFYGKLVSKLLRQSDIVIAITDDWAIHASNFGIKSIVFKNQYDPSYAELEKNQTPAIESDVLYVGGGARIKGFNNMISALPKLLKRPGIRLICLGNYSKYEKITLDRIKKRAKGGSHLIVVGYVPDIRPYLRGTKLLLLPIEAPHFCRPAIEAGFFKKTFIVPSFNGLKDFVVHGNNCLTYDRDNSHNFIEVVSDLLDNQAKRNELEKMNWRMSQNFYKNSKQIKILMSYIFKSRYHLMKK